MHSKALHTSTFLRATYKIFVFIFFAFILFFSSNTAKADPTYAVNNSGNPIKNFSCSGSFDQKDVKCMCPINSCRLSNTDGKYSCILGSVDMKYYLGQDSALNDYTDTKGYQELFGLKGNIDPKKSQFTDMFNANGTQAMIPAGSYCKVHPSDPNGVAYWYYPGYFYTLQGRDYLQELENGRNLAGVQVGGACGRGTNETVLFSATDLFGVEVTGTRTFFGCLPNSSNGIAAFVVRLVIGLALFITIIIVGINLILIIGNPTNTELVQESQKKMFAAIATLIGILLTITILNIFGIQIIGFGSEGIGGAIFRFFVGGS